MASGLAVQTKGFGVTVGLGDEAVDGRLEVYDTLENAALEAAAGELGKVALDGVDPRAGRRDEVAPCHRHQLTRSN